MGSTAPPCQVHCSRGMDLSHKVTGSRNPHAAAYPLLSGNLQGELLTQAPSVLLLGFHSVEVGQLDDIWPHCRTGAPTEAAEKQKSRVKSAGETHQEAEVSLNQVKTFPF